MAKIVIAEDSSAYRIRLEGILKGISDVQLMESCANGEEALRAVSQHNPDFLLLDLNMPVMDGATVMRRLDADPKRSNLRVIILTGTPTEALKEISVLQSPLCLDVMSKSPELAPGENVKEVIGKRLEKLIKGYQVPPLRRSAMSPVPVTQARKPDPQSARAVSLPAPISGHMSDFQQEVTRAAKLCVRPRAPRILEAVAIVASTAGIGTISVIMERLQKEPPRVPIFVTQHMDDKWDMSKTARVYAGKDQSLSVVVASDRMPVVPGTIYLAPSDRHMLVDRFAGKIVVRLSNESFNSHYKPAADPLLESLAKTYDPARVIPIVLTGIGHDGTLGVLKLRQHGGGYCLTQAAGSCPADFMPRMIRETGLASEEFPTVSALAERLVNLIRLSG